MQDVTFERWKYIGGSDIPIIMGLVNFGKTRWDLLLEKAQMWKDDFEGNAYTDYGNVMEEKIREYVNFNYDTAFEEGLAIRDPFRYHADGYDNNLEAVLEIKTTSEIYSDVRSYKKYLVQLLFGMTLYGVERGILAVYARPDDFDDEFDPDRLSVFPVERFDYQDIIDEVMKAVDDFLIDLDYLKQNPISSEEDLPSRSTLVPIVNKIIELEQMLVGMKAVEEQVKTLKADLKTAMEKAGVKTWTMLGGTKVTLIPDGEDKVVEVFDENQFRIDHADLYEQYTTEKIRKGKTGYVRITPKKGE